MRQCLLHVATKQGLPGVTQLLWGQVMTVLYELLRCVGMFWLSVRRRFIKSASRKSLASAPVDAPALNRCRDRCCRAAPGHVMPACAVPGGWLSSVPGACCRHIVREELEARKHAQHTNGFATANGVKAEAQELLKEQ